MGMTNFSNNLESFLLTFQYLFVVNGITNTYEVGKLTEQKKNNRRSNRPKNLRLRL